MTIERRRIVQNQAPKQRRIVFSNEVPDEERAQLVQSEDLQAIPADERPVDAGYPEDERRGSTSGASATKLTSYNKAEAIEK